jgi:LPS export ABC transporter protein LptC
MTDNFEHPPKARRIFTPQGNLQAEQTTPRSTSSKAPISISLILLGTAILVGGVIIGWSSFFQKADNIEISLETVSASPAGNLEMTGARYSGTTDSGVEFTINAERAVESATQRGLVRLYEPDGFVSSAKDGRTSLSSHQALYNAADKRLEMTGEVTIFQTEKALTLTSEEMTAFIGNGELLSTKPVTLKGPDIFLTSEGMHATDNGNVILFKGKSHIALKQAEEQP